MYFSQNIKIELINEVKKIYKRIAIISDIHGNKQALKLALDDIEKRNVDEIVCLGDLVLKYFYPKEVVETIKNNCNIVIKGNCDNHVVTNEKYIFAREQLGKKNLEYLASLPDYHIKYMNNMQLNFLHSTFKTNEGMFNPLINEESQNAYKEKLAKEADMFHGDEKQITFTGHTHMSYVFDNDAIIKCPPQFIEQNGTIITIVPIKKDSKYIINVGSIGEPLKYINYNKLTNLIDMRITYSIYDEKNKACEIISIPYRETLESIYRDRRLKERNGSAPKSPLDNKKIEDSLNKSIAEENITTRVYKRNNEK